MRYSFVRRDWITLSVLFALVEVLSGSVLAAAPAITSPSAAEAVVGASFTYTITASNTPTSFGATGLPAGLSVDTATGVISGQPASVGKTDITISATNASGTGTATLTLIVTSSIWLVTTVAGTGTSGFSGDGGPATAAELYGPSGVGMDSAQNVFFADSLNHRVRRVDAAAGTISTVAGNGNSGFSGDGGAATAAALGNPQGLVLDAAGNIFVTADTNRVRKVTAATGIISAAAGNGNPFITTSDIGDGLAATSATVFIPSGLALDADGNLYIEDEGNAHIRFVNASSGVISSVAGSMPLTTNNGFAGDGGPATSAIFANGGVADVALDAAGNIYIADSGNHVIRKVDAATNIITTIAGQQTTYTGSVSPDNGGFSGDGGPATAALLNFPKGVAVDSAGNIVIADSDNNRIRRVSKATGIITTIAGGGSDSSGEGVDAKTADIYGPCRVFVDPDGNILFSQVGRVRKLALAGAPGVSSLSPTSGSINGGTSVTISGSGFLNGATVTFGGTAATNLTVGSATQITCATPAHAAGAVDVVVTNPDSQAATLASGFTFLVSALSVSSLSPTSGTTAGGTSVTISGSDFQNGAAATFGGTAATNVNVVSATQITCTTPAHAAGAVDVVVTNPDSQAATLAGGYTYSADGGGGSDAPRITAVSTSQNPVKVGTPVQFSATVTQSNTLALTYTWDFGDSTANGTGNPVSRPFAEPGSYTVKLYVSDGVYTTESPPIGMTVYAPASGGTPGSTGTGTTVTNPLDNVTIQVTGNLGGVLELEVTVAGSPPAYTVSTSAQGPAGPAGPVTGSKPVFQFQAAGIYVITTTITNAATGEVLGLQRLTLPVSVAETGGTPEGSAPPDTTGISSGTLKGKFLFSVNKPDTVSFKGTIELPAELEVARERACAVSAGNVADDTTLDVKGKAKSMGTLNRIKKLQVKYPRLKKPAKTTSGGMMATVSFTLSVADLDVLGFGTEGVAVELLPGETDLKSVQRSIQIGVVLGGTAYRSDFPVQFKLSKKRDTGQISGRVGS